MARLLSIILILLLASPAWAFPPLIAGKTASGGAAAACANPSGTCTGFLVCQNFETTAEACDPCTEDNSESWDKLLGGDSTANTDDTTATVLRGNQQAALDANTSNVNYRSPVFTAQSELYTFFRFKADDATPSSAVSILNILDTGNNVKQYVQLQTSGRLRCISGATAATNTTGTVLSDNTKYYVWAHFKAETSEGANDGQCDVYVSTTPTKPASPEASTTGGTAVETMARVGAMSNYTITTYFDQVLVKTSEIGDVCE